MCKTISVSNQKGGVGKTTTSILLSEALGLEGYKVMCVDLDPQANMTMGLGYQRPDELELNISRLLRKEIENREVITTKCDFILNSNGIDFIPSSIELADLENILMNTMSRENVLKNFLAKYKADYDYIIIDCPPSLNILTVNALTASDEIIIPVQAQFFSAKGLEMLLQTIVNVRQNLNPNLTVAGALITMMDNRSSFQKEVVNIVVDSYGDCIKIFDFKIPLSVKVSESQSNNISVLSQKNNAVASAYINFAKELVSHE